MSTVDQKDEEMTDEAKPRSGLEQHIQTVITVVVGALLLWTGSTLVDIKQEVTTLKVQVVMMQGQLQSGIDDRFRGSDWRREKEVLDDRFRRIETEIEKHRSVTEKRP
jgi:hypothetical protein